MALEELDPENAGSAIVEAAAEHAQAKEEVAWRAVEASALCLTGALSPGCMGCRGFW